MVAQKGIANKKMDKENIPDSLIYEVMDRQPIYYKGYRDVLNKTKTREEIMACSGLQGCQGFNSSPSIYSNSQNQ